MVSAMDPVGIFDSGMGGLSVLACATRMLPLESFVYLGDSANAPYGVKPPDVVKILAEAVARRLVCMGCKAVVIACNTATSAAAASLREQLDVPVIGMEPALKPASLLEGSGRVIVMATPVTLKLPKFQALMLRYGRDAVPAPCPGLMDFVERGELSGDKLRWHIKRVLAPFTMRPIKAVVLGCTHYLFLREEIARALPPNTPIIDGNEGTVRQLRRRLEETGLLRSAEDAARAKAELDAAREKAEADARAGIPQRFSIQMPASGSASSLYEFPRFLSSDAKPDILPRMRALYALALERETAAPL